MGKYVFEVEDKGKISDGSHTFDELYHHRMVLFSIICNTYKGKAWKSWKHDDGTMFKDYFIVGITTDEGEYTYHYHKDNWFMFDIKELEFAPEWDGHKPEDITRLFSLLNGQKCTYEKLQLNKEDILVLKYPTDEDGDMLVHPKVIKNHHNAAKSLVEKVWAIPDKLELLTISTEQAKTMIDEITDTQL